MKNIYLAELLALTLSFTAPLCVAETITTKDNLINPIINNEITLKFDKISEENWQYNKYEDVYYKIGILYCQFPVNIQYQTLAIFVPAKYMTATETQTGYYKYKINSDAVVGNYTAKTAPIVMPVNTPGYMAMPSLTSYTSVKKFTDEGFIYVHAGCRGRNEGAPAGITDLKAAVRFLRFSKDTIPGNTERIFTFGMSGGGAQSALMGATGNSNLYEPYLNQIGAVKETSDDIYGAMCWCPITNLDTANEAYEWMMGSTRKDLSNESKIISDKLAEKYAEQLNNLKIKDFDGNVLSLSKSDEGIYQAGSYYEYLKKVIEKSFNNFIADTKFPYEVPKTPSFARGIRTGEGVNKKPNNDNMVDLLKNSEKAIEEVDNISRNETSNNTAVSGRYETLEDYINSLNKNVRWVNYDKETKTVTITSISDFVKACKNASKSIGAFDQLDAGQGENTLFGYGDGKGAHFDKALSEILKDINTKTALKYNYDLIRKDSAGNKVDTRLNMYTPLYYLLETSKGYESAKIAKHWRIRTGIFQTDCALCTELNLALALHNYKDVENVDFETVWGQYHTKAERTGESEENFIKWVHECMKK